jgi:hypothetical protein
MLVMVPVGCMVDEVALNWDWFLGWIGCVEDVFVSEEASCCCVK